MDGSAARKLAAIFILFAINAGAHAEDVQVIGSVDVNFKNLTFNPGGTTTTTPLTTINPNLILAYKRWYGSISYDGALADGSISMRDGSYAQNLSISRSDLVLTGGYRLGRRFSIFGGLIGGNITALQSGPRESGGTVYWSVSNIEYTERGPFLGGAYTMPVGRKSSLNFSAAYAFMQGGLKMNTDTSTLTTPVVLTNTSSSDTFDVGGLSYTVTLIGELNQSMSYRVGIKATGYKGKAASGDIVEKYTSFFFGVTNYF